MIGNSSFHNKTATSRCLFPSRLLKLKCTNKSSYRSHGSPFPLLHVVVAAARITTSTPSAPCCPPSQRSSSSSSSSVPSIDECTCTDAISSPSFSSWRDAYLNSPYDDAIFALAIPAVLALAADPLLQVIDTIFVGQTGPDALAALGINSALFTMSFIVFNFLATATTPLVATALATGDTKRAGTVTVQALGLATFLGTVLSIGLILGADQALILMGAADPQSTVFHLAKEFLLIRALAAPAVMLMTVGTGVFRGLQDLRVPLSITLAANSVNFALDTILILGLGWGVQGAATATTVAEWIAAGAYLTLLFKRRDLSIAESLTVDLRGVVSSLGAAAADMKPFLAAGGAVLLRTAMLLGTKTLASATAARLGPVSIASHQVVMQLWLLSSLIIDSLAVAGQTLVAIEKGKGDMNKARHVSNRLLQLGVAGGVLLSLAFWAAEPIIPTIFTNDAAVAASAAQILPLAIAMLPINAAVYVFDGILVGASDFKWMAGAMVVASIGSVGLLLGVEPLDLGLQGVWGSLALLMVGRLGTLIWRYAASTDGPLSIQEEIETDKLSDSSATVEVPSIVNNVRPVSPPMQEQVSGRKRRKGKLVVEASMLSSAENM